MNEGIESLLAISGIGFAASLALHLSFRKARVRNLIIASFAPTLFVLLLFASSLAFGVPASSPAVPVSMIPVVALMMLPLGIAGALAGGAAAIGIQLLLARD